MTDDMNGIDDFGFSMTTEDTIKKSERDSSQAVADANTKTQIKLKRVKDKIWPLLIALKKDAHLDVIKWANHAEVADKLMTDIDSIIAE
jgi:hypothetical protein